MHPQDSDKGQDEQLDRLLALLAQGEEGLADELVELLVHDENMLRAALQQLASRGVDAGSDEAASILTRLPADVVFRQRGRENQREKRRIGAAAAQLIADDNVVFLASGSTVYEVAKQLDERRLTVLTNSLPVMNLLADRTNIDLVSVGGALRRSEMSFIGRMAESSLEQHPIDKVVLGVFAIDVNEGVTHKYVPETMTDRAILDNGKEVIVVADHSKIGREAATFVAPLSKIHTLVTGREAAEADVRALEEAGVRVLQA